MLATGKVPSMTRAHFVAIAATLLANRPKREGTQAQRACAAWEETVSDFADLCSESNAFFDRDRFLRACGWPALGYPSAGYPEAD